MEDLIFLIRKESGQVSRIITYLGWKDVRKKVKDSEAADEGLDLESMEEPSSTSTTAGESLAYVFPPTDHSLKLHSGHFDRETLKGK